MSQGTTYEIPNVGDGLLFERFGAAIKKLGEPVTSAICTFPGEQLDIREQLSEIRPPLKLVLEKNNRFIRQLTGHASSVEITVQRPNSGAYATLTITPQQGHFISRAQVISEAAACFEPIDPTTRIANIASPEAANYLRGLEDKLQQLTNKAVEVVSGVTTQVSEFAVEGEKRLQTRLEKFESDYQQKVSGLEQREKELAERLKKIDDRESKHARRQLRGDLKNLLESRGKQFSLTTGTGNLRRPIVSMIVLLLLMSGFIMVFTLYEYALHTSGARPSGDLAALLVRGLLAALAFGGTAVYYLKWQNHWFRQHAEEEFRLKRFELDIDRASWVAEMSLEWMKDSSTPMPQILLERLTQNLFADAQSTPEPEHPADQLASALLGSAAKVTLSAGEGNRIELDRKAVASLKKIT